jgi:23S rRNA pseudouridine2605 synthase
VEREYALSIARPLTPEQAEALSSGVELEEGIAAVTGLRMQTRTEDRRLGELLYPPPDPNLVWVRVTIHQGWKRQLRRMFGGVGAPVRRLVRVRIGALRLDPMVTGDVRPLSATEVRRLASGQGAGRRESP